MTARSVLLLVASLLLTSICYAHGPHENEKPAAAAQVAGEEHQAEIEEVNPAEISGEEHPGVIEYLGRFHSAVVHFPIAWLILMLMVDFGTFIIGKSEWSKLGFGILIVTVASFVPALVTGFVTAGPVSPGSEIYSLMILHRNLNLSVVILCTLALAIRAAYRNKIAGTGKWVYLGMIFSSAITIAVSSHLGGMMVHGVDFFKF